MSNLKVSIQAFLEQIQSWSITLARQSRNIKNIKSSVKNKFKLNSIDIVLTEIQSLQIKYKKIRGNYSPWILDENKTPNFTKQAQSQLSDQILSEYSQLSKSFMDILQKVSLIEGESNEQNPLIQNNYGKSTHQNDKYLNKNLQKSFLNETFTYKASKNTKDKGNKSLFEKRKGQNVKEKVSVVPGLRHKADSMASNHNDLSSLSMINQRKGVVKKTVSGLDFDEDANLWQIRHQLTQIKTMMKEMKNEIKFHEHDQANKQINNIENKNRKICSQLKSIKQENRYILQKIEELKHELNQEKKIQVELINRFERKSSLVKYDRLQDSRTTHGDKYKSINVDKSPLNYLKSEEEAQNLSDWVKMRI